MFAGRVSGLIKIVVLGFWVLAFELAEDGKRGTRYE